jgi:TIR domain
MRGYALLHDIGVSVWYDEFSLKLGDSLSRSIDKGLSSSKYGVVVISKAFIEKRWPEYELQGLVTLERAGKGKRIIPIWHGVKRKEVMNFSPSLADKIAGDTSRLNISEIATQIIEIVRPDIFEHLQRVKAFEELKKNSPIEQVPIKEIHLGGPIRHNKLPSDFIVRI